MKYYITIVLFFISFNSIGQERAVVYGKITDEKGRAIELANVAISGLPGGTMTDQKGRYELEIPANTEVYVTMSFVGLEKGVEKVLLQPGERYELNMTLKRIS